MPVVSHLEYQPVTAADAPIVQALYQLSPTYFHLIAMEIPDLSDVEREVETLLQDERRRAYLIYAGNTPVGYLDYKVHYPEEGEATISLLLIAEPYQKRGYGTQAVADLEVLLKGQVRRLYAVVYGNNPPARRFWERQGFRYLKDGGVTLTWFAKEL
ncbi:GNAT family N-acetyltransferase [Marinithermus hydrothermalis]|uniref:GCN5-related N-acetyltransferase n=1 Tax=Marinithermus hydrothermalis (strain DSM 14884 / JCM 11576 / T1) TaxID=869210 RepID=F2NKF5_MARHT|nr:GNAT family N-acetyltransferase [Marinithermus hydrothermalis]AEB12404.1 GCN5-related N-acetyltransferase [Marinithermus hydrothermalis DSM 14884]